MLFINHLDISKVTILIVYVDDIIVIREDEIEKDKLSQCLPQEFKIKAFGRLKYLFRIEVVYSKAGIFISQHKYIVNLLQKIGMTACKSASTPVDVKS